MPWLGRPLEGRHFGGQICGGETEEKEKRSSSRAVEREIDEEQPDVRGLHCGATSGPVQPPSAASGSETLLQLTFVDVGPVLPPKAIQIPAVWTAA